MPHCCGLSMRPACPCRLAALPRCAPPASPLRSASTEKPTFRIWVSTTTLPSSHPTGCAAVSLSTTSRCPAISLPLDPCVAWSQGYDTQTRIGRAADLTRRCATCCRCKLLGIRVDYCVRHILPRYCHQRHWHDHRHLHQRHNLSCQPQRRPWEWGDDHQSLDVRGYGRQ